MKVTKKKTNFSIAPLKKEALRWFRGSLIIDMR